MTSLVQAARKAREWTERRDALIREQRDAGQTLRDLAEQAGLSHTAIRKIAMREP